MKAMAGRARVARLALLVGVLAVTAACDDGKGTKIVVAGSVLQPSFAPVGLTGIFVQPQVLVGRRIATFACPTLPPLTTTFNLFIQPQFDVSLQQVTLHFIDGSNIGGTPIPFPTPQLQTLFGSNLFIRAGLLRAFPFSTRFGCVPLVPTMLAADVVLVDTNGRLQQSRVTASIQSQ